MGEEQGWWSEELWRYDAEKNKFRCYYPVSSYEKDFYTEHTEKEADYCLKDETWVLENQRNGNDPLVTSITVEDGNAELTNDKENELSIKEKVIQRINKMTERELEILLLMLNEKEK